MTAAEVCHSVVSQEEWLAARKAHLEAEKAFTRQRDELSRSRRALPWVKVDKNYVFDGPQGRESMADLFAGRTQLIIYHFMFGPDWEAGCSSCSYFSDHIDGMLVHLAHRDVSYAAVSRAPLDKIEGFRKRMGWQFHWVSSNASDFNFDFNVSFKEDKKVSRGEVYYNYAEREFPSDEAHGASVFTRDGAGNIFHTYSTYGRGLDILIGAYNFLDLVPKGRDEDVFTMPMAWLRHHDRYEDQPSKSSCCSAGK